MRNSFLFLLVAGLPLTLAAQSTTIVSKNGKSTISWDQLADRPVTVEGLAWGAFAKGLGPHLVLPSGRVYVRGVDFEKHDLNGRLVAIAGVLRKGHVKKAPAGSAGYASDFDYFYVDATSWKIVERLTNPQVLPRGE